MDSVVQPSNNRGQVFCLSLPGLEILTTVRPKQNINNTNEPAKFFGLKYYYNSYYDACPYKRFTYCGKIMHLLQFFFQRNELNVFTFTWFPFYLKPYKDFVWRICIDPSQWLWGEGLKLKVLIPMFSQNNFHLRWYTLTTIIQSIFYRLEAEGRGEVRILGIT